MALFRNLAWVYVGVVLAGCAASAGRHGPPGDARRVAATGGDERAPKGVLRGEASYYASSLAGNRTANGERYNPRKFTAASPALPFGTRLRVTRIDNGKSVVVRVNDRGPFGIEGRILDLSRAAANALDMIREGHVAIEAVILD